MVRVLSGESFEAAVEWERKPKRRLFQAEAEEQAAPEEGVTAGATSASTGRRVVHNGTEGCGPEEAGRRRGFTPGCALDDPVFPQESTSCGADGRRQLPPCTPSRVHPLPPLPSTVRTGGAGVPEKSKGSGSYGPAMPPPGVRTEGASAPHKSNGLGSCGPQMPLPGMPTESSGSCGPETPTPRMRAEGAAVFLPKKSKASVSGGLAGPTMPPPGVRMEGAGVSDMDALHCSACFLPLKPPIFFKCCHGHAMCSLCHDKLKATSDVDYNPEDSPLAYNNATIHSHLNEYTSMARAVHDFDGEVVMRVEGGKKHGWYWIDDNILDTATSPTLSQIRARSTSSSLAIHPRLHTAQHQMEALQVQLEELERQHQRQLEEQKRRLETMRAAQEDLAQWMAQMMKYLQSVAQHMGLVVPPGLLAPFLTPPAATPAHMEEGRMQHQELIAQLEAQLETTREAQEQRMAELMKFSLSLAQHIGVAVPPGLLAPPPTPPAATPPKSAGSNNLAYLPLIHPTFPSP